MIEFFEVMFRALTGLRLNMPNLISLFAFFAAGYLFARFAKNIGILKALLLLIVGYFIANILSALLGVYTLAFALGFVSNQGVFLYRLLLWAEDMSEIYYSFKHRRAYEEIRSREDELEAEINRLREELHRQQSHGAGGEKRKRQDPDGQDQAKSFERATSQQEKQSSHNSGFKPSRHRNQKDIDAALIILGLEIGKSYSERDIKKAYRRLAMIHHPDLEGGSHVAFVRIGTATEYLLKFEI